MLRKSIREKTHLLVKKYGTTNPYKLCEYLGIPIYYKDLGKNIMGFRTVIKRVPMLLLSTRNSENEEYFVCSHELGHHICKHKNNADKLTRENLRFIAQGDEFEANCFMVELLLYDVNLAEYFSRKCLLRNYGLPDWAERYVDWDYLEETANFDSFNSCY